MEASQVAKDEGWEQGAMVLQAFVDGIDVDKVAASGDAQ